MQHPKDTTEALKLIAFVALLVAVAFASSGCATASTSGLPNMHQVDADLFRSAQPTKDGYEQMKRSGIRTVLKLNTDNLEEERAWAKAAGITLLENPLPGLWRPTEQSENGVQRALIDQHLRPLLFHCEKGADRTGMAAALYRVHVQHWNPDDAHSEWLKYGHSQLLFTMDAYFQEHAK